MGQFLQRLPLLLVAFIFLVVAASKTTDVTDALLAAGLVVLGAWVAVEVVRLWETTKAESEAAAAAQLLEEHDEIDNR